jgi:hypothetical protein
MKNIDRIIVRKNVCGAKIPIRLLKRLFSAKFGKITEIGHFCIVAFKYIKMFSTRDQMFQKSCLGSIEVEWIAQSL